MTYRSVIRNFSNIGSAQAEKLREQLSLSMPIETLKFCGAYYKNQIKRDPYVDELKMLDLLISARKAEGSSLALTEFYTNDTFVARTYADLLKKRKQLYPNLSHPCTLGEAANIATEYIRRAKGETLRSAFVPSIENVRDSITYPDIACVSAGDSAYRMRLLPLTDTTVDIGDALILMAPTCDDSQSDFRRRSARALQNKELMHYVKGVSTVGHGGILRALLRITDGAHIQLSALSPIGMSVPATTLCDGFCGCSILRVASHQWNIVTALLAREGVRPIFFATIKKEPQFVFMRDKQSSFVLDARFLKSLNQFKATCAKLVDEPALDSFSIAFGGIGGGKCTYLTSESAEQMNEVVTINSTACVATYASAGTAPYKTALWSVLASVAALCARGIPYRDQMLSIALEFPLDMTDAAVVGNCISTILGLYRVQAELGLATADRVSVRATEALDATAVSVWTTAQNIEHVAGTFTKSGSFVYVVSPALDKDGIPDFSAVRQLFAKITKFSKEGKILSCRTLVGEAITDGIRKMSHSHTCVLSDKAVAADGKLPFCILIESEEDLPLRCIGKVYPWRRLPKDTVQIPECTYLIMNYQPDIVIVASLTDNNAMALAAHLEGHYRAHVSLFTNPTRDAVDLSRAILTTQTLILCPNAKLPQTKYMDFAIDTLRRAGGILLSLSKNATPEGFVNLKNGIDTEILLKICPEIHK